MKKGAGWRGARAASGGGDARVSSDIPLRVRKVHGEINRSRKSARKTRRRAIAPRCRISAGSTQRGAPWGACTGLEDPAPLGPRSSQAGMRAELTRDRVHAVRPLGSGRARRRVPARDRRRPEPAAHVVGEQANRPTIRMAGARHPPIDTTRAHAPARQHHAAREVCLHCGGPAPTGQDPTAQCKRPQGRAALGRVEAPTAPQRGAIPRHQESLVPSPWCG